MKLNLIHTIIVLITLAAFLLLTGPAKTLAQEELQVPRQSPMPAQSASPQPPRQSLPPQAALDSSEITILRDNYAGKYNTASLENLSKLYWRLGAFDLSDDLAIGNFVKINDCKVFTDFVNDDMEWAKIIDVMRDHLAKNRDTFPLNFQFVIEMHLGRYDPVRGGFPLVNQTGFKDATRISVDSIDRRRAICFDERAAQDYPRSILILLPEPFTLDFVELDEHVAQAYILRKKALYEKLDEELRVKRYERDAFLRLRVTFSQYNGNLRADSNTLMAILYGKIDGYELFEDDTQKRLMLSVDLKDQQQSMMSLPPMRQQEIVKQAETKPSVLDKIVPSFGSAGATPVSHSFAP